jgi:methylaspartate mutase epsilon subunit
MTRAAAEEQLVVQPRMGFSSVDQMRDGLRSVKFAAGAQPRIGTITVDAFTRLGHFDRVVEALATDQPLNGFPIVSHGADVTRVVLDGLLDGNFPVQVRHGSPFPMRIFEVAAAAGLDAIEGGPVSYNLPYSREPLPKSIAAWREAARFWAGHGERMGVKAHLETFAGCMFGQLCPPDLLVALSLLECKFFRENGIQSVSLSLAQGIHDEQDIGALIALSRIAARHLGDVSRHIVFYTFMGRFPLTRAGAQGIIGASARIAVTGGAHRLIVKTVAEAHGIPTIEQNVEALHLARKAADAADRRPSTDAFAWADLIEGEAEALIAAVSRLAPNVGDGLLHAFANGVLDIPHCPHPANRSLARAAVDPASGALVWSHTGNMPVRRPEVASVPALDSDGFDAILDLNKSRYDLLDNDGKEEMADA